MTFEVGFAQARAAFTVGGFFDVDIGNDALGLNGAAVRRVVARGGQLDRRVAGQRQHGLDRAFAEGRRTENDGALVILQGAGDDFRC